MRNPLFSLAFCLAALLALPACGGADGIGLPIGFPPTITGVSPTSGSVAGGTLMGVAGTNFTSLISVTVDGNLCLNVSVTSSTNLSCIAPSGTVGAKDVRVATATGSDTLVGAFTYVQPLRLSPGKQADDRPLVDITFLDADGAPLGLLTDVLHQQDRPDVPCGDERFALLPFPRDGFTPLDLYEVGSYYFGLEPESGAVLWYSDAASLALGACPDGWCLDTHVVGAVSLDVRTR